MFSQLLGDVLKVGSPNFKLARKDKTDASLLVSKLVKDKTNEKEKFDAIFYWVAKNIQYDESFFYTVSDYGPETIKNILKTKKTICLGYAQLMDSFCLLAGINNVTVFGFAKGRYYDVGDSIYGHNHAWNAVRLDGLWYLYDATWSHGVHTIQYTKKAKFILKLLSKIPEKFKKKSLRVPRKFRKRSICKQKIEPIIYYKPRFFNGLIRLWLMKLPIKVLEKIELGVNGDFYLSDPSLFAISHVPDDPTWSLLGPKKSYDFEQDSSFYYLTDSTYKNQKRKGEICFDCDDYYNSVYQKRLEIVNQNSSRFNPNNKFITTLCYDELGKNLYVKSLNATDNRLSIADSSLLHYQNALVNMSIARNNLVKYFKYEKAKNDFKARLLLEDNKNHIKFIKNKVNITHNHTRLINELVIKSSAFATVYHNRIMKFQRYKTGYYFAKVKPYSESRINELEKNHINKSEQLDTLLSSISSQKNQFDSIITHLSLNIWQQVFRNDTILVPFKKCIVKRRFLLDNYKRVIVDIRKEIYPMENKYTSEIDYLLYDPSAECVRLFNLITREIKLKHMLLNDLLKIKLELVKTKELPFTELSDFKSLAIKECESDFCWLSLNYPKQAIVSKGLHELINRQRFGLNVINFENETERTRQGIINRALKLGYKSSSRTLASDNRMLKKKCKEVAAYRKELNDPKLFNEKRYWKIVGRLKKLLEKS